MSVLSSHSMAVVAVLFNSSLKLLAVVVIGVVAAALLRRRGVDTVSRLWVALAVGVPGLIAVAVVFPGCHHTTAYLSGGGTNALDGWSVAAHLWALGALGVFGAFWLRQALLDRIFRMARALPLSMEGPVATAVQALGLVRTPDIRLSGRVPVACTWGLFRPRVLLPEGCTRWPAPVLDSVVRHELAHVGGRDWAVMLLTRLTTGLLWFHPVAWWMGGRVRRVLELAADARVVHSGVDGVEYAEHLLWVRGRLDGRPTRVEGALSLRPGAGFAHRVRRLLRREATGPVSGLESTALIVALVGAATVALSPPWLEARSLPIPAAPPAQERSGIVLVANRGDASVTVLDAETFEVVTRLPVGEGPHELVVDAGRGRAYVASYDEDEAVEDSISVTVLDLVDLAVERHIHLPGRRALHGIALSAAGDRLWLSAENEQEVLELDAESGQLVARYPTGGDWTHVVEASPDGATVYASDMARGEIAFIDRAEGRVRAVPSGAGAEGLALSPDGSELWVANRDENTVSVLDADTGDRLATIPVQGEFPVKLRFTPDGSEVWVTNNRSDALAVISSASRSVVRHVALSTQPLGLAFSPDGSTVLVSAPRLDQLLVVDRASGRVVRRVDVGSSPDGIAWYESEPLSAP